MTKTPTIVIIGAGNMGVSLLSGLISNGHPVEKLWAADPDQEKLINLKAQFNIHTDKHNQYAAQNADVLIFAVKPQMLAEVVKPLAQLIVKRRPLVISVAAGVRTTSINRFIGDDVAIVRAMPNTSALINCGATALFATNSVTHAERNLAESIMRSVGAVVWVHEEALMDVVTALSGSGPAYFFYMMEALLEAAESMGLPRDIARLLTLETALGAARMAIESGKSLTELRHQVTSPGGTTEQALFVLEKNKLKEIFQCALQAAKIRSEELAELMDNQKNNGR